jgi:hypothetical protein
LLSAFPFLPVYHVKPVFSCHRSYAHDRRQDRSNK